MPYPIRPLAIALVACGVFVGCSASSTPDDAAGSDMAAIVQPQVHLVDGAPGTDLDVTADRISAPVDRFGELATYSTGDVLVSGKESGFIRRIRGSHTEGDRVIVDTEPASLSEVFKQVHLRGGLGDQAVRTQSAGLAPQSIPIALGAMAVHGAAVPLDGSNQIEILDGGFDYQPTLDFDFTMRDGQLQHLKVLAGGASTANLHIRYALHNTPGKNSAPFLRSLKDGIPLLQTPPYYAVFMAGWVPVVVAVRAKLVASYEFNIGGDVIGEEAVGASGAVSTGLEYVDGAWRDLSAKSFNVYADGSPTVLSHNLQGDLTLTARLDVSFYDLAGPYVGLQAYAGVGHAETPTTPDYWFTQVGVRGIAGAQVAVFGKALVGYEAVLFDVNKQYPM